MDVAPHLVDQAVAAFRQRLLDAIAQMHLARGPQSFCEAERVVFGLAQELAADLTQRVLQDISTDTERRQEALEKVREKASGIEICAAGSATTSLRTLGGQRISIQTSYARAKPRTNGKLSVRGAQGTGVYPILDELGILGRSTPALRLRVSRAVCEANSVASAREMLGEGGVDIDHKAALRLTYLTCDDALRARKVAVKATKTGNPSGEFSGRRVVAAVDGGRVNIRRRVAGRPRKDGRKKFVTEWREPKVLTLYVIGDDGKRDREIRSVIDGTLGDADAIFALMVYHLRRLGADQAKELILIGDGAPWIWNRAAGLRESLKLRPDQFHEIVDYYHVVERLGELSQTQAHLGEAARLQWLHHLKKQLKAGNIEGIEAVVEEMSQRQPEEMAKEVKYWSRNRERLRYAAFRERGFPVGSGAVESSVRRVINLRLKGASISWTEPHAEGILHLRAHAKSGRWDELEDVVLNNTGWRPSARRPRKAS
jgi:hypothetical protein